MTKMIRVNKNLFARCLLFAVLIFAAVPVNADRFDKGLLWKVASPAGKTSYVFGTIHLEDSRVTNLPLQVQRAFDEASRITLEMTMDPAVLINMSLAMMLTDGRDLQAIVGETLYKRSVQAMESYGMPALVVAQMKPWAVATTLITPKPKTGIVLDLKLYQDATSAGKKVDGLETWSEQLDVFDRMDEKLQVKMLEDTLDHLAEINTMYQAMLQVYLDRDLGKMVSMNERYMEMSDPELSEQFNDRVIVDRNHRMVERMESRLKEGSAFIAVGALHLPGGEGVLNLLSQRGYRISRVY